MGKVFKDFEEDRDRVVQKSVGLHQSTWEMLDAALGVLRKKNPKKPPTLNKVIERLVIYGLKEDAASEEAETTPAKAGKR